MKIISGNSNKRLAEEIASSLNLSLVNTIIESFADKEILVEIGESLIDQDVFLIQSTSPPVNDTLMELLVMCNAIKQCSPKKVTAIIPYYGYARQDRPLTLRSSIGAEMTAHLLKASGIHRIVSVDVHAPHIRDYFEIPFYNLSIVPLFYEEILKREAQKNILIISPDEGGRQRAKSLADSLKLRVVVIHKARDTVTGKCTMQMQDEVKGYDCIIIDDLIDSGETLCKSAELLMEAGANSVKAYCTHGVLSLYAIERLKTSLLTEVFLTDTIYPSFYRHDCNKIQSISVAPLLSETILHLSET